jgi:UDP-N-acetylglucosamine pyrophosphorylase
MQNKVPKLDSDTLEPVTWAKNPDLEWCPPGHGDLYAALAGGKLDELLADGFKYAFVSNSDNLGASLDLALLTHFAESGSPMLMEVCERTAVDKKGGHLATRKADGRLILREAAQTSDEDEDSFQDTSRHRFFNTNNLWLRLDRLKEAIDANGGAVPLPMIKNDKTVDPKDSSTPSVVQLETAMGAAIEQFDGASAVVVPRSRFAPVKKTTDLLSLRSDAYVVTEDFQVQLAPGLVDPPNVKLDKKHFKLVQQLEAAMAGGVPSLLECTKLDVKGPVLFAAGVAFKGSVKVGLAQCDVAVGTRPNVVC